MFKFVFAFSLFKKGTDIILTDSDKAKNNFGSSIHCRKPKRTLVAPAKIVPYRKRLRDPILSIYLPKTGENTIVVTNAQPNTQLHCVTVNP